MQLTVVDLALSLYMVLVAISESHGRSHSIPLSAVDTVYSGSVISCSRRSRTREYWLTAMMPTREAGIGLRRNIYAISRRTWRPPWPRSEDEYLALSGNLHSFVD